MTAIAPHFIFTHEDPPLVKSDQERDLIPGLRRRRWTQRCDHRPPIRWSTTLPAGPVVSCSPFSLTGDSISSCCSAGCASSHSSCGILIPSFSHPSLRSRLSSGSRLVSRRQKERVAKSRDCENMSSLTAANTDTRTRGVYRSRGAKKGDTGRELRVSHSRTSRTAKVPPVEGSHRIMC